MSLKEFKLNCYQRCTLREIIRYIISILYLYTEKSPPPPAMNRWSTSFGVKRLDNRDMGGNPFITTRRSGRPRNKDGIRQLTGL